MGKYKHRRDINIIQGTHSPCGDRTTIRRTKDLQLTLSIGTEIDHIIKFLDFFKRDIDEPDHYRILHIRTQKRPFF